ncbi:Protein FAM114A2 [Eumeta japonica]|uniref:Protein FAM114A2 n=1 Tax=Eumeta variegata TaxID=151549 RepID=A0A4C1TUN9_EUMVA|nr:Protein FAM114A2 [Eumeta japonica]
MPSSESEDFESADEGPHDVTHQLNKKERKKRFSSSNYSDSAQESDQENKKSMPVSEKEKPDVIIKENIDGWDDFNIDVSEVADHSKGEKVELKSVVPKGESVRSVPLKLQEGKQDTGWDDFDDWDQDVEATDTKWAEPPKTDNDLSKKDDIKAVADKLSSMSTTEQNSGGSSWGWGSIGAPDPEELAKRNQANSDSNPVNKESMENSEKNSENEEQKSSPSDAAFPFGNIISGVTKFVETTELANHSPSLLDFLLTAHPDIYVVSIDAPLGLSDHCLIRSKMPLTQPLCSMPTGKYRVFHHSWSGHNAPVSSLILIWHSPGFLEECFRVLYSEERLFKTIPVDYGFENGPRIRTESETGSEIENGTRVENECGDGVIIKRSKVITGGLDTLETIGKKTMEVLQDGDPGLVKKKAMLGLDAGDKPVLSQLLREAKEKAEEEDRIREEKREAKEVHYETLFDDFEGLVHLEALEMLSKQVNMRIEERLRNASPEKRQEIKETLQQVAELCEMPEEDDDDDIPEEKTNLADTFHERLREATEDLGLKLQFQPLVKHYTEVLEWLSSTDELSEKNIYKKAVSSLAQCTALCVEIYHKSAEMLLVKTRRSTADEADALTQMTVVLTKHINDLATHFTEKLNSSATDSKESPNNYITNVFLEVSIVTALRHDRVAHEQRALHINNKYKLYTNCDCAIPWPTWLEHENKSAQLLKFSYSLTGYRLRVWNFTIAFIPVSNLFLISPFHLP